MKIEVTIELDPALNTRGRTNHAGSLLNWIEHNHYGWQHVTVVQDGDTVLDWTEGTPTPRQLDAMRREVVQAKMYEELGETRELTPEEELLRSYDSIHGRRLGTAYEDVIKDYDANPDAEWVKQKRKSVKASINKRSKEMGKRKVQIAKHEQDELKKQDLIRDTIDYEIARQDVLRSNGLASVDDHRIAIMVSARVEGYAPEDPTPTDDNEQKTWDRICRSVEAEATFDLPRRFTLMDDTDFGHQRRHVSFDF